MEIFNKILHSYAMYCRKEMVKILKFYLILKKSYGTLSKGEFFWPTLYIPNCTFCCFDETISFALNALLIRAAAQLAKTWSK